MKTILKTEWFENGMKRFSVNARKRNKSLRIQRVTKEWSVSLLTRNVVVLFSSVYIETLHAIFR